MKVSRDSVAKNHVEYLQLLGKCSPKQRKELLKTSSKEQIDAICECAANAVKLNLTAQQKKSLNRHSKVLNHLVNKNSSQSKKKILVQKGEGLPLLLASVIPALLGLLK